MRPAKAANAPPCPAQAAQLPTSRKAMLQVLVFNSEGRGSASTRAAMTEPTGRAAQRSLVPCRAGRPGFRTACLSQASTCEEGRRLAGPASFKAPLLHCQLILRHSCAACSSGRSPLSIRCPCSGGAAGTEQLHHHTKKATNSGEPRPMPKQQRVAAGDRAAASAAERNTQVKWGIDSSWTTAQSLRRREGQGNQARNTLYIIRKRCKHNLNSKRKDAVLMWALQGCGAAPAGRVGEGPAPWVCDEGVVYTFLQVCAT